MSDENRTHFELASHVQERRPIAELEDELRRNRKPQLLFGAPDDGIIKGFAVARMRTAGVGPVGRPEPFIGVAPLQQRLAVRVEDEQRERAMQQPVAVVAGRLVESSDLPILFVNQDQRFVFSRDDLVS